MAAVNDVLTHEEATRVRELIRAIGSLPAARRLEVSAQTAVKLAAEIPTMRAIVTHARAKLACI